MHPLTIRALLAALVILAGSGIVVFFNGPAWSILLAIAVAGLLKFAEAGRSSKSSLDDPGNEIGHANLPPTFSATSQISDNSFRRK